MPHRKRSRPPLNNPATGRPWWTRAWFAAAALLAITLFVYLPAFCGDFIWDDRMYLVQGSLMQAPLWRLWIRPPAIDYLPLTFTFYWLQWALWPGNAVAFHVMNVMLHGATAVMLWRVLRRLEVPGAWLAAALFAVHPVCVESVAWIAEEKNTLSLFLAALSLWLYLDSGKRARNYGLAVLMFALALFAKPSVIMLPVVLVLLAWWKNGEITRTDWRRSTPFFVLSALFAIITIWYQRLSIGSEHVPLGGAGKRLAQTVKATWFYLSKLLVPRDLMFFYPRWRHSGADWLTVAGLAVLIALGAVLWRMRTRWGRGPLLALACYTALLLPILGMFDMAWMQFAPVADHYQYPAMIALLALVSAAMERLFSHRLHTLVAAILIAVLGTLTFAQAANYHDEDTLWRAALARNPEAWAAYGGLGLTAGERGDWAAAAVNLKRAAELNPKYSSLHNNLGTACEKTGDTARAIAEYTAAARLNPKLPQPEYNLGNLLLRQQRAAEAEPHLARAVELMPESSLAEVKLGSVLLQLGKIEIAAQHLKRAAVLDPGSFEAHAGLAECLRKQGRVEEAYAEYQRALALRGAIKNAPANEAGATRNFP